MREIQLGFLLVVVMAVAACGDTSNGTGGSGGSAGTGGSAGSGGTQPPVDQCVNGADQAIFDELGAEIGEIVAGCGQPPSTPCGGELGLVLGGDTSEGAATALGDCIAQCVSDDTGLSTECTSCYGLITVCTIGSPCLAICAPDPGSAECATCSTEQCGFLDACLGI
jgi:hypothetical protein